VTAARQKDGPLVSVVLPTHNRAPWVGRAVESVLAQSHRPTELIVVDDGSTDETAAVLKRFGPRITVLTQPRSGAYAARNLGVRHASGELVAFIDSDDAWYPDRLAAQLPLMDRAEVGLVFGDAVHIGPAAAAAGAAGSAVAGTRERTCFATTPPSRGRVAADLAWGDFVPTVTVLVRRACLEAVGGFPTSHAVSADYLTWFRIAADHELDYVNRPVADYTVHAEGISHDLGRALAARIELFSGELDQATDPAVRAMLQRLVFNLGLHLAAAVARGRARSVAHPWRVVRGAARAAASRDAPAWTLAFLLHQARVRAPRRPRTGGAPA
jgi:glycosyltransferase involved in cell wall biosynthesis